MTRIQAQQKLMNLGYELGITLYTVLVLLFAYYIQSRPFFADLNIQWING